eukprot:scaffold142193_cov29-Prasinocladus_malaysianus.AAC.1
MRAPQQAEGEAIAIPIRSAAQVAAVLLNRTGQPSPASQPRQAASPPGSSVCCGHVADKVQMADGNLAPKRFALKSVLPTASQANKMIHHRRPIQ